MVFPSLYCSEASSSLFEVSYNNTQPYALISGDALGRHKVNGGIPDGWQFGYSTALRFQMDSCVRRYTLVIRASYGRLSDVHYAESHPNTLPKRDSH